jgi:beta-glucuronidase
MLRPQDTATWERKLLTGLRRFRLDGAGEGRDVAADAAVRNYVGDVWYQTVVRVPRGLGRPADRAPHGGRHW